MCASVLPSPPIIAAATVAIDPQWVVAPAGHAFLDSHPVAEDGGVPVESLDAGARLQLLLYVDQAGEAGIAQTRLVRHVRERAAATEEEENAASSTDHSSLFHLEAHLTRLLRLAIDSGQLVALAPTHKKKKEEEEVSSGRGEADFMDIIPDEQEEEVVEEEGVLDTTLTTTPPPLLPPPPRRQRSPLATSDPTRRFVCGECNLRFHRRADVKNHHVCKHVPPEQWKWMCPGTRADGTACCKRFWQKSTMLQHAQTHLPESSRDYQCTQPECTFGAVSRHQLKTHLYRKHQLVAQ